MFLRSRKLFTFVNTHVTIYSNIFVLFLGSLSPSEKYYHVFAPGLLSAIIALGRRARAKWCHCTKKMADLSDMGERTLQSLANRLLNLDAQIATNNHISEEGAK